MGQNVTSDAKAQSDAFLHDAYLKVMKRHAEEINRIGIVTLEQATLDDIDAKILEMRDHIKYPS
jgi:hypothetical protein